jgi:hypothetical protein
MSEELRSVPAGEMLYDISQTNPGLHTIGHIYVDYSCSPVVKRISYKYSNFTPLPNSNVGVISKHKLSDVAESLFDGPMALASMGIVHPCIDPESFFHDFTSQEEYQFALGKLGGCVTSGTSIDRSFGNPTVFLSQVPGYFTNDESLTEAAMVYSLGKTLIWLLNQTRKDPSATPTIQFVIQTYGQHVGDVLLAATQEDAWERIRTLREFKARFFSALNSHLEG